jgi:hypothetical protein
MFFYRASAATIGDSNRATAASALFEVALVIFLRRIKFRRGQNLRDDRALEPRLCLRLRSLRQLFLLGRGGENHRSVLRAHVGPLPVWRGGIVLVPEHLEQILERDFRRVVGDLNHLGVVRAAGADVLVARIFQRATLVTADGFVHAGHGAKSRLDAPEATRAEAGFLQSGRTGCPGGRCVRVRLRRRFKTQRDGVEAVAQAGGTRTVLEDVAEVGIAPRTDDFRARHAVAAVDDRFDIFLRHRLEETWPAGAGIEFRVRFEQGQVTADAVVDAILVVIVEHAAEGLFGAFAARDPVLFTGELLLPFLVGFDDFLHGMMAPNARVRVDGDAENERRVCRGSRELPSSRAARRRKAR